MESGSKVVRDDTMKIFAEADVLLDKCDFNGALKLLDRMIFERDLADVDAHLTRGTLQQCLGRHEKAINDFTVVLKQEPLNTEALFRRGVSLRLLSLYEAAAEDFLTAQEIEPCRSIFCINFKETILPKKRGLHFLSMV